MKNYVLRLWMKTGTTCDLLVTENDGMDIYEKFRSRWYHINHQHSIDGITTDGVRWSFEVGSIGGMVLVPHIPQPQAGAGYPYPFGNSGRG